MFRMGPVINTLEMTFKYYVIFGGGGHQKITLDYRGRGVGPGRAKKGLLYFLMFPKVTVLELLLN